MRPTTFFLSAVVLTSTSLCLTETFAENAKGVSFQQADADHLEVRIDGTVFAVLNHGKDWSKPYLFPVNAPNGNNILRTIVPTKADQTSSKEGMDHFHHKGVWVAVDSVNDEKFNYWHEKDKIISDSVEYSVTEAGVGVLKLKNTWLGGDTPLLKESTTVTYYPNRLVTYHIEVSAIDKDVTFHDTKEGFFAVRIAHTMRQSEGGHIVNADGLKGDAQCWGKPTAWIDYYGDVNGKTCGVTLMDHPDNFRKSRYHVRGYGLFSISPFGPHTYSKGQEPKDPVTVSAGKAPLKLTYAMYVHDGDTEAGNVADAYQQFLKATGK